jgi:hypothetical protein
VNVSRSLVRTAFLRKRLIVPLYIVSLAFLSLRRFNHIVSNVIVPASLPSWNILAVCALRVALKISLIGMTFVSPTTSNDVTS